MDENIELQKALYWWNNLPNEMKAKFPPIKSNTDILHYYTDPAGNMYN